MKKQLIVLIIMSLYAINLFSQSTDKMLYYKKDYVDADLGNCSDRLLIFIKDKNVHGYFCFVSDDGSNDKFLSGTFKDNIISGNIISTGFDGVQQDITDKRETKIEISQNASTIKLFNDIKSNEFDELKSCNLKYNFIYEVKNLREEPNTTSKIISKIDIKKTIPQLIEIGNFEKIGSKLDCWYKIKVNNLEGWVFGGLVLN